MLPEATHSSYVHVKVFLLQIHLSLHIMNFSVDFYSFIHRLFEDAADKLNLMALAGFLYQLKKASQAQLFHSVTDTVDYSLAMPGRKKKPKKHRLLCLTYSCMACKISFVLPFSTLQHFLKVLIFPLKFQGIKKTVFILIRSFCRSTAKSLEKTKNFFRQGPHQPLL